MTARLAAFCALLLVGTGCSLFRSDPTLIVATGRIILAETGEPVQGLGLSLYRAVPPFQLVAATTRTGADGRFRIEYDPGEDDSSPHAPQINDEPYDARYTTNAVTYVRGETRDTGDLVIRLNSTP